MASDQVNLDQAKQQQSRYRQRDTLSVQERDTDNHHAHKIREQPSNHVNLN